MRSSSVLAAAVVDDEEDARMRVRAFGWMIAAVVAMGVVMGTPLFAHHGDAAYADKPMEMKGCVVKEFDWMNPQPSRAHPTSMKRFPRGRSRKRLPCAPRMRVS